MFKANSAAPDPSLETSVRHNARWGSVARAVGLERRVQPATVHSWIHHPERNRQDDVASVLRNALRLGDHASARKVLTPIREAESAVSDISLDDAYLRLVDAESDAYSIKQKQNWAYRVDRKDEFLAALAARAYATWVFCALLREDL